MYIPPSTTDEDFRETAEELQRFFGTLLRLRPEAILLSLAVIGIGAIGGLVFGCLMAVGQSLALGFRPAWEIYGSWWLASPLIGAIVPIAIFFASLVIYSGTWYIERVIGARTNDSTRQFLGILLLACFLFAGAVGMPILVGYQEALRNNPILSESNLPTLDAVDKAVSKQSQVLEAFASSGRQLLDRLDGVRSDLSKTLLAADSQLRASEQTSSQISDLLKQQRQIELRTAELQRILGGAAPITKQDLETSSLSGLVMGTILGFVASLGASIVYGWFARFRRKRTSSSN